VAAVKAAANVAPTTASPTRASDRVAAPSPATAGRGGAVAVARPVEPSGVRAGEWDDNANYREFSRWLGTEASRPYHRIDVRDRQFVVVRDADGKAVPRCPVVVSDGAQHTVTLTTTASGRALLFPHAEGLVGRGLVARASCGDGASSRFSLDQGAGVVDLRLPRARALPAERAVDLAFILDTTGSMSEEIASVKTTIQKVASSLRGSNVKIRVGLVEYKDRGDAYVTRVHPMSRDLAAFSAEVADIRASGGGDVPESMNEGVHVALQQLDWAGPAVAKLAFLVGDAPPHLDYAQDFDYAQDARDAAHRGIQLFTIAASGMDDLGQIVFRQLAAYTGATNMFVLRGGAGPQSAGAGDPRSSCGGRQTAYASGNLDALVLAKIEGEIRAVDADPMRIAGLQEDENAKPCEQRLVMAR
jgi:hypothetical protein